MPDPTAEVAALRAQVAELRQQLSALDAYVKGFKGDGSGVEVRGNVLTLRPPEASVGLASRGTPQVIDGVCIGGVDYSVTFLIVSKVAE